MTSAERDAIRSLRREVAELKRANEDLKSVCALVVAAEVDGRLR